MTDKELRISVGEPVLKPGDSKTTLRAEPLDPILDPNYKEPAEPSKREQKKLKTAEAKTLKKEKLKNRKKRRGGGFSIVASLFGVLVLFVLAGAVGVLGVLWYFGKDLPDYDQLASYEPPVMTRVLGGDGELVAEFAYERRLFMPIEQIPDRVKQAFLSAEDKNFYTHPGIDFFAVLRAAVTNVNNIRQNRRSVGASTITQQVMKNFLLTKENKYVRKVKEAILALRFEKAFTKDRILELYLNQIYLGARSYGVAAASLAYFGKPLDKLDIQEMAYLAALPKAPSDLHPIKRHDRAVVRRNYVINEMVDNGYISVTEGEVAKAAPLEVILNKPRKTIEGTFFIEEVRRQLQDRFGEDGLYKGGLAVRTTFNNELQTYARDALRRGLVAYDFTQGWRGPLGQVNLSGDWKAEVKALEYPLDLEPWRVAVVTTVSRNVANITLAETEEKATIPKKEILWARKSLGKGRRGPAVKSVADVLSPGDVIFVVAMEDSNSVFRLRQVPEVNGALVALDPKTGRVLAMQGGFSFAASKFNRASQAKRQPGSSFKPFVYAAALDNGFTPSSIIVDAPVTVKQPGQKAWKPSNYGNKFYGPSTLRVGIERSRNLMTVQLAQKVGMDIVVDYAKRFDIDDNMQPGLAMALGAGETTLLRMVGAYATLLNHGQKVTPTLIERVQDRRGKTLYAADGRSCDACQADQWTGQLYPVLEDPREQIIDPATAYQVVSMLQGVVQRGTATKLKALGRPVAGKTGTTNDAKDAWFVGFTPDLVTGVYIGFDQPRSLGKRATGGGLAAPIFLEFMKNALEGRPKKKFKAPKGIHFVRIDRHSGRESSGENTILEAYKTGSGPGDGISIVDYQYESVGGSEVLLTTGSGGLY